MRFLILLNKKQLKKLDFLGTEPKKPTTKKKNYISAIGEICWLPLLIQRVQQQMITSCTTNTRKYNYKSWKPRFWELMDSFILFAYASLVASRTLLQRLLACLNFTLELEDLSFLHKRKKWFLWTMAAAQAAENYGDEWGLTWCFQSGIYTSIPTWTHSQIH